MLTQMEKIAGSHSPSLCTLAGARVGTSDLLARVALCAGWLEQQDSVVIAFLLGNSFDWVVLDLACQQAGKVALPLPAFFTRDQLQHALQTSGCRLLLEAPASFAMGQAVAAPSLSSSHEQVIPGLENPLRVSRLSHARVSLPRETSKITFTSGSTGHPKGVCLSSALQQRVALSLVDFLASLQLRRHLCLLPLPILLENVAGLYVSLLGGGDCLLASATECGFDGAGRFNPALCKQAVVDGQVQSLILLPQLLSALLEDSDTRWAESLRFVAVGGAAVPEPLLQKARHLGLPVYQGYGLSECGSVVSVGKPGMEAEGSAGCLLPHLQARIDEDSGELMLRGAAYAGYLGEDDPLPPEHSSHPEWLHTGDLAEIRQGFIYLKGRLKNLLITSYGRNISPEWPESLLLESPVIHQAMVTGDGQPFPAALLFVEPGTSEVQVCAAIEQVNARLPDYARLQGWCCVEEAFSRSNGCLTANGRLRRKDIERHYAAEIARLFALPKTNIA